MGLKKFLWFVWILVLGTIPLTMTASADLTKHDIEEIRMVVKEEIQHVNYRIDGLDKRIDGLDKRIDGLDKRIDGLQEIMIGGFGVIFTGMFALITFVLWDRRSALAPAVRRQDVLEKKEDAIERALKDFAMKEPRFAEALRVAGLL
ncbi:MAG: hypothetical protein QME49_03595 [bacterium]|nr:hypothetical protein [bacterium]